MSLSGRWAQRTSRRRFLELAGRGALVGLAAPTFAPLLARAQTPELPMDKIRTRIVPSSGERVPVVGLGTWQTFDVGPSREEREPLAAVLRALVEGGGSVVDSSPMYGRSEAVVGELAGELELLDDLFVATKVWTRGGREGAEQMRRSIELLGGEPLDLMQIHNLVDWQTHLPTLRAWKLEERIRYLGITHYTRSGYDAIVQVLEREPVDFLQIDYSIADADVEERVLPAARDNGVAVLINRPYDGGSLFGRVRGREVPEWAREELRCESWGQFFLKWILGDETVTCVIPGTSKVRHLRDNLGAGTGPLPDAQQRARMRKAVLGE